METRKVSISHPIDIPAGAPLLALRVATLGAEQQNEQEKQTQTKKGFTSAKGYARILKQPPARSVRKEETSTTERIERNTERRKERGF